MISCNRWDMRGSGFILLPFCLVVLVAVKEAEAVVVVVVAVCVRVVLYNRTSDDELPACYVVQLVSP